MAAVLIALMTLCGCAGGSKVVTGLSTRSATLPVPALVQSAVQLLLTVQGALPPGTAIGGIDVIVNLPPGVTVRAEKSGATKAGVVVHAGGAKGALAVAKFTPSAGETPGKLRVAAIKVEGFAAGLFAMATLDVSGALPNPGDFSTAALIVTDTNGLTLNGLTVHAQIQGR